MLDNRRKSYSLSDSRRGNQPANSISNTSESLDSTQNARLKGEPRNPRLTQSLESEISGKNSIESEPEESDKKQGQFEKDPSSDMEVELDKLTLKANSTATDVSNSTAGSTTMQEYIEKYYTVPSKASTSRRLPAIAEKEHRLVENIINYRHTSTKERETIHRNRYEILLKIFMLSTQRKTLKQNANTAKNIT